MSAFPDSFQINTQLISDDYLTDAADIQLIEELANQGYEVHTGLNTKFGDAIVEMALEPAIKEYCPNDSGSRFSDRHATENWLQKGRAVFLLLKHDYTDDDLHMVGYGWAGAAKSPHVPEGETTFAIRIGEAGQGRGLATPFAKLIVNASAILYDARNMWLETWKSNGGAVHVYHKIGFEDVTEVPAQRTTANGEKVPDTRIFMSLPNKLLPNEP